MEFKDLYIAYGLNYIFGLWNFMEYKMKRSLVASGIFFFFVCDLYWIWDDIMLKKKKKKPWDLFLDEPRY